MSSFREILGSLIIFPSPVAEREIPEVICRDSRRVVAGAAFVAIKGVGGDGNDFIPDARACGAEIIVGEVSPENADDFILVSDGVAAGTQSLATL